MAMRQCDDLAPAPQRPAYERRRLARSVPTYTARELRQDEAAFDAALRLRQAVFAHELAWVPASADGRERDRCDGAARHFAVFARMDAVADPHGTPQLVAYARVLVPANALMLEREFSALKGGRALVVDPVRAFEVSRLVVDARWRGQLGMDRRGAVEHLGRAIARWALRGGRTEWLSVCEVRHVRALRLRGLPFSRFGRVVEYQAGVPVCAVRLDLLRAAARLHRQRLADYAWYTEGTGR
jgi:N-acyl-L-homoserine lactone synthetase